jgi:uncharacterized protein
MKVINFTGLKFRAYTAAFLAMLVLATALLAQNFTPGASGVPQNTGFVNDYADVIDAATKDALEKRLKGLRDGTPAKIEIGVLTVRSTEGKDIFDYSLAVAREWKLGSKEQDNPALLLVVAIDDRKYFTQTSRDAEGDIPDGLAGQIQRQYLVPAFKQGQYSKGIQDTVDAYIRRFGEARGFDPVTLQRTEGTTSAPPITGTTKKGGSSLFVCAVCGGVIGIIIFIFLISTLTGAAGSRRSSWNGGSFGGGGRKRGGSSVGDAVPWIVGGIIGSLLSGGGKSGGSDDWGGGSSGGGGGDWGGFGGGGDFGGGGAGGDW